jgi:hypothetical protein
MGHDPVTRNAEGPSTRENVPEYGRETNQGESVFRLRNVNIVGFYSLFLCATCFDNSTIFIHP